MDPEFAREYYESASEDHWWFRGRKTLVEGLVARHGAPSGVLLDLGAGRESLLPPTTNVVKLDVVKPAGVRGRFVQGSATRLPFRSASFDGVGLFDVLEHLDEPVACLREVSRVMRPGAAAFVTVPAHEWLWSSHDVTVGHKKRYSAASLANELVAAGFSPVVIEPFYGFLLGPAAVRTLLSSGSPMRMPGTSTNRVLTRIATGSARRALSGHSRVGLSLAAVAVPSRATDAGTSGKQPEASRR